MVRKQTTHSDSLRTAIVVGGAKGGLAELEAVRKVYPHADLIAVNDVGAEIPDELAAWCSLHGYLLINRFMPKRKEKGYPDAARTFTGLDSGDAQAVRQTLSDCVEAKFPGQETGGSSGHFAVKVALCDLGYDQVILCGVPMTEEGGHYFTDKDWSVATSYWSGWKESEEHMRGKVTSMSGWTKELLGAPEGVELLELPQEEDRGVADQHQSEKETRPPESTQE